MKQAPEKKEEANQQTPLSLWKAILLVIILVFGIVALFGVLVYLFTRGAQLMGLPSIAHIAILVIISGIFAWLLKRLTDIVSGLSYLWFSDETDDENQRNDTTE